MPKLSFLAVDAALLTVPAAAQSVDVTGPLTLEKQGSFFVGRRDMQSDTLSTLPAYAPSGTITVDQMYVRYHLLTGAVRHPALTFIHGCSLIGKC